MLMQIDGTFIFVIISFLIFLFIIKAILYTPITKALEARQAFYLKNEKMESESKEKTKNLLEEKQQAIQESKDEASLIIKSALDNAKEESNLEIKRVKQFAKDRIQKTKENLEKEKTQTKEELKAELSNYVSKIVSQVLGQETQVTIEDNELRESLNL